MDEIRIESAAPERTGPVRHSPAYDGEIGDLARIALSNGLLNLATLGFYRFWGKTRLRRYLWSHVSFQDDRLEYTGRARELLIGFFVVLAILLPLAAASISIDIAYADSPDLLAAKNSVQALIVYFLIYVAIFRARRYRLSRTQWRGIRAGQSGSAFKYALLAFWSLFLASLTFGLAYPYYRTVLQRYRTENTWFGDRPLRFAGSAGDLFGSWVVTWICFIPTLGLIYAWYRVKEFRYYVSRTSYRGLSFQSKLETKQILLIYLVYSLATIVAFALAALVAAIFMGGLAAIFGGVDYGAAEDVAGLATAPGGPWPQLVPIALLVVVVILLGVMRVVFLTHPMIRVLCKTLTVLGEEDYAAIAQSQQTAPGRGEGLADALDVGAI